VKTNRNSKKVRFAAVLLLALALLAAGCGTRVKEQTEAAGNGGLGGDPNQSAPGGATPGGTTAGGGPAGPTGPMFGTLPVPCGPNTSGAALAATGLGVTESEIVVSTISDPGGAKPGLNQSLFDSMAAFAKWCNGFGGINGRKLVVEQRDAKLVQYKEMVVQSCGDSLALVGGLGALDSLGAQDQVDCGLVNVPAAAVSADASDADFTYSPLPNPANRYFVGPTDWVKANYPDTITQGAAIYSKFAPIETQSNKLVEGYEARGFKFPYHQSSNINEENWGPIVVAMKNQGVKYLTLTSSFEEIIPLQKTMAAQGWHPEVTELETNFYDQRYPEQAKELGADTTNTYVRLTVWPFEEKDDNPAMKSYLELLEKGVPGAIPAELGVQAWSAGLLFATAAKAAGPNLTRETLMAELEKVHSWNAGGLHGTTDPGTHTGAHCFVMMKVDDGKFVRAYPLPDKDAAVYNNDDLKGMACPKDSVVELKGDYGHGAKAKK
jgi:ABC-type branched-subunit amino acid transport system substrate-binding protein